MRGLPMKTVIKVEQGEPLAALRSFLRMLLQSEVVEAVYVPEETEAGSIAPALVTSPARLESANPLAPIMPVNGARNISALTGKGAPKPLAVVLRPCETRALVELVKLKQASLDEVLLIGIDCPGTYEVSEFSSAARDGGVDLGEYFAAACEGREPKMDGLELRLACRMCTQPIPEQVDVRLHLFGADLSQGLPVSMTEEISSRLVDLPVAADGDFVLADGASELIATRTKVREKMLGDIQKRLHSQGGFAALFADCIRCHNCMTACPICYCKTCLFRTASFDHPPEHYYAAAKRKGALRLPGDTLLFHMTRLNHMSASCVSCGMCTSACPVDIPVGTIFSSVGERVQAAFDYLPGRSVEELLPLITFQADEWTRVGE
jgi:formate dehydrogenase (coenzyme F420) beta subunit